MSDPQDPLAALAAAARKSPPPLSPVAKRPLSAAAATTPRPIIRKQNKISPLPIFIFAAIVLVFGIIVGVTAIIIAQSHKEIAIAPTDEATRRATPPEPPDVLFNKVKPK